MTPGPASAGRPDLPAAGDRRLRPVRGGAPAVRTCTTSESTGSTSRRCWPPSPAAPTATTWSPSTTWTRPGAVPRGSRPCPPRPADWGSACSSTSCPTTSAWPRRRPNAWWWDVLQHGPRARRTPRPSTSTGSSASGRLLVPVLGDDDLPVDGAPIGHLEVGRRRAALPRPPVPDSRPAPATRATRQEVHARQHYELVGWRRGDSDLNYRRFFAITTLAGVRVEDPAVFAATHARSAAGSTRISSTGCGSITPTACATREGYLDHLARPHRQRLHAGGEDPRAGRGAARAAGRSTAPPGTTPSPSSTGC